jgi:hypothetical protein
LHRKEVKRMAKKNQKILGLIHEAISRIRNLKDQVGHDNPKLSEAFDQAEKYLLNQLFEEFSPKPSGGQSKTA